MSDTSVDYSAFTTPMGASLGQAAAGVAGVAGKVMQDAGLSQTKQKVKDMLTQELKNRGVADSIIHANLQSIEGVNSEDELIPKIGEQAQAITEYDRILDKYKGDPNYAVIQKALPMPTFGQQADTYHQMITSPAFDKYFQGITGISMAEAAKNATPIGAGNNNTGVNAVSPDITPASSEPVKDPNSIAASPIPAPGSAAASDVATGQGVNPLPSQIAAQNGNVPLPENALAFQNSPSMKKDYSAIAPVGESSQLPKPAQPTSVQATPKPANALGSPDAQTQIADMSTSDALRQNSNDIDSKVAAFSEKLKPMMAENPEAYSAQIDKYRAYETSLQAADTATKRNKIVTQATKEITGAVYFNDPKSVFNAQSQIMAIHSDNPEYGAKISAQLFETFKENAQRDLNMSTAEKNRMETKLMPGKAQTERISANASASQASTASKTQQMQEYDKVAADRDQATATLNKSMADASVLYKIQGKVVPGGTISSTVVSTSPSLTSLLAGKTPDSNGNYTFDDADKQSFDNMLATLNGTIKKNYDNATIANQTFVDYSKNKKSTARQSAGNAIKQTGADLQTVGSAAEGNKLPKGTSFWLNEKRYTSTGAGAKSDPLGLR